MAIYVTAEYRSLVIKETIANWGRIFEIPKSTFSRLHRLAQKEGNSSDYFIKTIIRRRILAGKLTKDGE